MKKKLILVTVSAMTISMLASCGQKETTTNTETKTDTEAATETEAAIESATETEVSSTGSTLESYEGDGWSLQYDSSVITALPADDESVTFSYYPNDFTPAGTNYMIISKKTDTDYETVLKDMQESYGAEDAEINMTYFGAEGTESYSFNKTFDASEDSDLQISVACTAIPVDSDVILIESYNTLESDEENAMKISAVFETVAGTFTLTTATSSAYQTYEFETYDGDTVTIDDSNIVSQELVDEPLEWEDLPADAEQLAPGKDCVLLGDADNYYVEDAVNGFVTIATK